MIQQKNTDRQAEDVQILRFARRPGSGRRTGGAGDAF
jgi:hypothetical protein